MVGGKVIGLARSGGSTLVHVGDKRDTCSIRVIEKRRDNNEKIAIEVGDSIWWQGNDAMWTPKRIADEDVEEIEGILVGCRKTWDIHLPRLGYSH